MTWGGERDGEHGTKHKIYINRVERNHRKWRRKRSRRRATPPTKFHLLSCFPKLNPTIDDCQSEREEAEEQPHAIT